MPVAPRAFYDADLAYAHAAGYGDFARAAVPGLLAILRRAGVGRGTVVELGCGSGAATEGLVAAGYEVVAIDASPAMLRLARARVPGARFALGRLPSVAMPACDAVVAVGEVVSYLASAAAIDRLLGRVLRALVAGGVLVFDVRLPGRGGPPVTHARLGADWAVVATSTEDRGRGTLIRRITTFRRVGRGYRRSDEVHRQTLLSVAQLLRRVRAAGFAARALRRYGTFRLPPANVVIVARKARGRRTRPW